MKLRMGWIGLVLLPMMASAGEARVTWLDFNDYRDVRPSNENRSGYHDRVAKQLEKHIQKLAKELPEGYDLALQFDDVDLAGDVLLNREEIRVIKPIYFPRFKISYSFTAPDGKLLAVEKQKELKDMAFMDRIRIGMDESLHYEKQLLTEWFESDLKSLL